METVSFGFERNEQGKETCSRVFCGTEQGDIVGCDFNMDFIYDMLKQGTVDISNKKKLPIQIRDQMNRCLCAASRTNRVDIMEVLLKEGADENGFDSDPLNEACRFGNKEALECLIKNKAILNDRKCYGLELLVIAENIEMVKMMFDAGAQVYDYILTDCHAKMSEEMWNLVNDQIEKLGMRD